MEFFDIDPKLRALGEQAEHKAREQFAQIDRVAQYNSEKVLSAFIKNGVSESHFTPSTGYGYGDRGRAGAHLCAHLRLRGRADPL